MPRRSSLSNVLLTSLGSTSADIAIKSLKRLGHRVVGTDIYPKQWVADAYNVDVFYQVPLVSDAGAYLAAVHQICLDEHIDYFIPLIDLEVDLLNVSRQWFDERGITLCISTKHSLDIIRNKKTLQDFVARECPEIAGIPTLMVGEVDTPPWDYPVVVKPLDGRSSQGREFIHSPEEWRTYKDKRATDKSIVEPYISGPIVMVEVVRQKDTGRAIAITRKELLDTPNCLAITVEVRPNPALEEATLSLAEKLDVNGCVNFEFFEHEDGTFYFCECNPRYSAGLEFSCLSGYDMVANHLECYGGRGIDPLTSRPTMIIARKYEEYITAVER